MPADLLITNARVLTIDPVQPRAEAVAIQANRIVFVGAARDASAVCGPATRVVDAGGATLLPGLIDSHYHLLLGSLRLDGIQLEGATSLADLAAATRSYATAHPHDTWLAGYGLRYGLGPAGGELTRHDLDAIEAARPLLITAFDGHTAWANTRALELSGALHGYECGPNSEIVFGPDGLALGELREPGAFGPLRALIPKPDAARRRALLRLGLAQAARVGITSVHNMDGDMAQLELYQAAEQAGELSLRVYVPYSITPTTQLEQLDEAVAMRAAAQSLVRAGAVKFFMDGVIEGYTGLVLEPYAGHPDRVGEANFSPEHFQALAIEADRRGLQIFVHAIGDRAVRRTLDGFAAAQIANGVRDSRHRVEHLELIDPSDMPRFAALGAIASMQPYHAPIPNSYGVAWLERVGPQRWERSFAWRSVQDAGALLAFGSDWPVVSQSSLIGLAAVVGRTAWRPDLPSQAISLSAALAAYTVNGAYAEFQEQHKGMLRVGLLADLVLLDRDLAATPVDQIVQTQVMLTICDGRVVFEG
jgi:predicted amidohydrolase YtcJ